MPQARVQLTAAARRLDVEELVQAHVQQPAWTRALLLRLGFLPFLHPPCDLRTSAERALVTVPCSECGRRRWPRRRAWAQPNLICAYGIGPSRLVRTRGRSATSPAHLLCCPPLSSCPRPLLSELYKKAKAGGKKPEKQKQKVKVGAIPRHSFPGPRKRNGSAQGERVTACGLAALVSRGSSFSDGDPDAVAPFGVRRPLRRSDPSPALHCTGPSCDCGPVGSPPAISCRLPC